MRRYRVELLVNDKVVATLYRDGWTRSDAYHDTLTSDEYRRAKEIAVRKCAKLMWDAILIKEEEGR